MYTVYGNWAANKLSIYESDSCPMDCGYNKAIQEFETIEEAENFLKEED